MTNVNGFCSRRPDKYRDVRMSIVAGSTLGFLGGVPEPLSADACVSADVIEELSRHRPGYPSLRVPLAVGETTTTLFEKAVALDGSLHGAAEALRRLPSVSLADGLGALPVIGVAALRVALQGRSLDQQVHSEIIVPLLRKRNGTIRGVHLNYFNVIGGGTGTWVGKELAALLARRFALETPALIAVSGFQIGALTFLGLGTRVCQNAAAGLLEQIAYLLDPDRLACESRELAFAELPTVDLDGCEIGDNRERRSALAAGLVSACGCARVRERLLAGRSNRALASPLGSVTVWRADWYGAASVDSVIGYAARFYAAKIASLLHAEGQKAPDIEITVSTAAPPAGAAVVLQAAGRPGAVKPPNLEECLFAGQQPTASVSIDGATFTIILGRLREGVGQGAVLEVSTAARAIVTQLETLAGRCSAEVERSGPSLERAKNGVRAAVGLLFPAGLASRIEAEVLGRRRLGRRFRRAYAVYLDAWSRHARAVARARAAESALVEARSVHAMSDSVVKHLSTAFENLAAPHGAAVAYVLAPWDEVGRGLAGAVVRRDIPLLRSMLASSAREITIQGLAELLRCDASVAAIAGRLLGSPEYEAPYWGGAEPASPPFLAALVIPPLNSSDLARLGEAAAEAGLNRVVLCGDTLAGGAAVVGLEAYFITGVEELLAPPYRSGLRSMFQRERDLYPLSAGAERLARSVLGEEAVCA